MPDPSTEFDYLVTGAGATGMAFVDTILTETSATVAIVDRHAKPGGHWNDAYPFVRLHQPAHYYGVNSTPLGSDGVESQGFNEGLADLASGAEILAYFDNVMRQRFLPTGRVSYWPMSEVDGDGTIVSLLSGDRRPIAARKVVDAHYTSPHVPATSPPKFEVAAGVTCVPVGELPRSVAPGASYVVVGAGKTGIDACLWLLENGTHPDRICWIMPRDAWLYDRAQLQPGHAGLAGLAKLVADQVEALTEAESVDDVFERIEAKGSLMRLDPAVRPTMHHCAIVSRRELEALRRIRNVVRLGRVRRLEPARIVLERGAVVTEPGAIHVNCTACAFDFSDRPPRPIFDGRRITLQLTRHCSPTFSAAFIAHVEATYEDEARKNELCPPIPYPTDPVGWLRIQAANLPAEVRWSVDASLARWLNDCRLNIFQAVATMGEADVEEAAELGRYLRNIEPALARLPSLLAGAEAR